MMEDGDRISGGEWSDDGNTDKREAIDGPVEYGEVSWLELVVLLGEARPLPSQPLKSDGAGVQGGVSMAGMGWSLKQADS